MDNYNQTSTPTTSNQNNQGINTVTQTPQSPEPKKINHKLIYAILGGVIVLLLIIIGVLITKTNNLVYELSSNTPAQQPTPAPVGSPTPLTTDPTADWKTYTFNTQNNVNISLKAPREITVYENSQNPESSTVVYVQNYGTNEAPPALDDYYQLYITYQWSPSVDENALESRREELDQESIVNTTLGSYPAISGQVAGKRNRFVTYSVINNGLLSAFTAEPTVENKILSDQILSTFKFTE